MANKKITDLMSGTPVRDSLLESAIDISGTMDSRKVKAGAVADLASANVAAPYDSTVTYAIGQYCLQEGNIYRCIAPTTGAFDSTKWTQIVVTGEFRRVVELTSAQYAALSSAEKNNGTIYIQTDAETTGSDIAVSSSDSTSIAEALEYKEQSVTIPTYGGTLFCRRFGRVVSLTLDGLGDTAAYPSGSSLNLSGIIPQAYRPSGEERVYGALTGNQSGSASAQYALKSDGTITVYAYADIVRGKFSISYIV